MSQNIRVIVGATALMATLALSGCSHDERQSSSTAPLVPPAASSVVAATPTGSLPTPEVLTDVLSRLTDPAVAGADKVGLVEGATPQSAANLDKFSNALRDDGYLPMSFAANNITWSDQNPSYVMAIISVDTAHQGSDTFTFPMEFTPGKEGWQLSRRTAEMLLALSNSPGAMPPTPPG